MRMLIVWYLPCHTQCLVFLANKGPITKQVYRYPCSLISVLTVHMSICEQDAMTPRLMLYAKWKMNLDTNDTTVTLPFNLKY